VLDAWIVTGGMNFGVMKIVGEAVRNYTLTHSNKKPIVAIGTPPWGCINNRQQLINSQVSCVSVILLKNSICCYNNVKLCSTIKMADTKTVNRQMS